MNDIKNLRAVQDQLNRMILKADVGQINPYPVFQVLFTTLARVAIQKGQRGILALLINDTTVSGDEWVTLKSVSDIDSTKWTPDNQALLLTAFSVFSPQKVLVKRQGSLTVEQFLKEIEVRKISQLACPELEALDDAKVVAWIKGNTNTRNVVYVSAFATNSDNCGIVELNNSVIKHKTITNYDRKKFTVMVAGAIAGCPLNRSLDNIVFPDIVQVDDVTPANGKFILFNDDEVCRVKMALNSKTTFDSVWRPDTRFIKIYEGMTIVKLDIQDTFKNYWAGLYLNTYDNKRAFCDSITKVYFAELQPNVLSPDFENYVDIDMDANRRYIINDGKDPDTMTETEIKTYNTGADVYLTGEVRFQNVMINLSLLLQY